MAGSASSQRSTRSNRLNPHSPSHERTPLLSRTSDDDVASYADSAADSPAAHSLRSLQDEDDHQLSAGPRWPTIIALSTLCVAVLAILGIGFAAPAAVQGYAKQALVFEPTKISIDSFTSSGVNARIQGTFLLDASRVHQKSVRGVGLFSTYIAREIESGEAKLEVYLPAYDNVLLGTANIPPIKVNIQNNHVNFIDFVSELQPGPIDGIRKIANDWLDGRLGQVEVKGVATLGLKSGIFYLGTQTISQSMVLQGQDLPAIPGFDISKLKFYEAVQPGGEKAMVAEASATVKNDYPVRLDVPRLGFDISIANCLPQQDHLQIAKATTEEIEIRPKELVDVSVSAVIKQLPEAVTSICPGSTSSPLDVLLGGYIQGLDTTIYVTGADAPSKDTPGWITDLARSVTVPLPFPGRSLDNLIRNFTLAHVHFRLPNPTAEPGDSDAYPRLSAVVKALVKLPKEMNFRLDVDRVRADADVFYHGKKLGELDLHEWQAANTSLVEDEGIGSALSIQSEVDDAPLNITDDEVFTEVVQSLVFGRKRVVLNIKAKVDVNAMTALGDFVVRQIPAEGEVFVKPISTSGGMSEFKPSIGDLEIVGTTKHTVQLQAKLNITNPTDYSAHIPYINIHLLNNDTVLGHATARDVAVRPGKNTDIVIEAVWNPSQASGESGRKIGRDLLSQFVSGFNTTLTLKTHEESVPSQPALGRALSSLGLTLDTRRLKSPSGPDKGEGDGDERDGPHFLKDATMHLISSSATFIILSPFEKTSLFITSVSAVAFYNHTESVGTIEYDLPFEVPPGVSTTPRLPVDWGLGGAGYDAVRDALGGSLKLDAKADAGVRIGKWEEKIWFVGSGIGAHIRL